MIEAGHILEWGRPLPFAAVDNRLETADANKQSRYEVDLTLDWNGVKKEVLVTFNDRSDLYHPLLIGRNFLTGDFVVDVQRNSDDRVFAHGSNGRKGSMTPVARSTTRLYANWYQKVEVFDLSCNGVGVTLPAAIDLAQIKLL